MPAANKKGLKIILSIFWSQVGIFILLLCYFAIPFSHDMKRAIFPFAAVLALAFFLLGAALIFYTLKRKVEGKLKKYLILAGASSAGFLVCVLLHNFFYGFGMISENIMVLRSVMEFLHVAFFLIAMIGCPSGFLVGAVGSIVMLARKNKRM